MRRIEVLRAGPMTTVQDLGRPGLAQHGIPPSGGADLPALTLGNRLVGNPLEAAALEATLAGPRLRFEGAAIVALAGAEANATVGGRPVPRGRPIAVAHGETLELGGFRRGVRGYVCVRGGVDAEPTLGSRSADLLTGLGPPPLRDGDLLAVGAEPGSPPGAAGAVADLPDELVLRVRLGPRDDWFTEAAVERLCSADWRVTSASNRVGIRLVGPLLERRQLGELLSEGVVTGAVQVPPAGRPIVLLPDHPTTGGYPVIAVVESRDLWLAGQAGPGATVHFAA